MSDDVLRAVAEAVGCDHDTFRNGNSSVYPKFFLNGEFHWIVVEGQSIAIYVMRDKLVSLVRFELSDPDWLERFKSPGCWEQMC